MTVSILNYAVYARKKNAGKREINDACYAQREGHGKDTRSDPEFDRLRHPHPAAREELEGCQRSPASRPTGLR